MRILNPIKFPKLTNVVICALALGMVPVPAHAQGSLMFGPQAAALALLALGTGSHCVKLTYDLNGNRLSQSSVTIGSGTTNWGVGDFGCFTWEQ